MKPAFNRHTVKKKLIKCVRVGSATDKDPTHEEVINQATGTVDQDRLRINMELAMDVYISQVNHCLCGDTQIH